MSKRTSPRTLLPIALVSIVESVHNPRKVYEPAALQQLADSLVAQGQLTPITVRPIDGKSEIGYELAAGHRRFRAAKLAGLEALDAIVREMTDEQFLEVMTVEQLQHADFTPYEEALSYANLLRVLGKDVTRVAARVNKERRYIADRLRLLTLSANALDLLQQGRISVEHATLLSTLSADDQQRVIDNGLFVIDRGLFDSMVDAEIGDRWKTAKKPISVHELRAWINTNVRLDLDAVVTADLFPETVKAVEEAEEARRKHAFVTHLRNIPAGAKDGPRILKAGTWKDAGKKPCEYTMIGTVLLGPQRGASLRVCTAKVKCETHWRDEIKAAERQVSKPGSSRGSADDDRAAKQEAEREKAQTERERWAKHAPAIVDAIAEQFSKVKMTPSLAAVKEYLEDGRYPEAFAAAVKKHVPVGPKSTVEELLRHVVFCFELRALYGTYNLPHNLPPLAKRYGVDAKAMIKAADKADAVAASKAVAKKTTKKKGGSR